VTRTDTAAADTAAAGTAASGTAAAGTAALDGAAADTARDRPQSPAAPGFHGSFLYDSVITHTRTTPLRNVFRYGSYLWLVDLDHLPQPGRLLRRLMDFRTADHFDGGAGSIRRQVDSFLAGHGIDLCGGQVRMLSAARVLGYVFNPLSVYWCHDPEGRLVCVLAEVHNTYRGRHTYLIHPDPKGGAEVDKNFYVSPFEPAAGARYRMSLPEPGEDLALTITLHRPGAAPFVAGVRGRRRRASAREVLRMFARHPLAPMVVTLRIRWQGVRLVLRGLPIVPRPEPTKQEAAE
jgi:DUF1365 family protein